MANKQFNFGFEGNENHVGEHDSHPAAAHKGCSLYNVITEEPKIQPRQNKVWPQREDKLESAGKAFNVSGRTVPVSPGLDSKGKPWGW